MREFTGVGTEGLVRKMRTDNRPMRLRQAVVDSVSGGVANIRLADTDTPVPARSLGWYQPVVGDSVWVLENQPDLLILGRLDQMNGGTFTGPIGSPFSMAQWAAADYYLPRGDDQNTGEAVQYLYDTSGNNQIMGQIEVTIEGGWGNGRAFGSLTKRFGVRIMTSGIHTVESEIVSGMGDVALNYKIGDWESYDGGYRLPIYEINGWNVLAVRITAFDRSTGRARRFLEGLQISDRIPTSHGQVSQHTGWRNAPLINNWENYGGSYANARFRKDQANTVHLEGLVRNGTNPVIFMLPEGFRPSRRHITSVRAGGGNDTSRVDIVDNGEVRDQTGVNGWISLSGITFHAEW